MKVLFDNGVPRQLGFHLQPHEIERTQDRGWDELRNGNLLKAAEAEFGVLITTDSNIKYQQNFSQFHIAVIVLRAFDISIESYLPLVPDILAELNAIQPGEIKYLYANERLRARDQRKGKI